MVLQRRQSLHPPGPVPQGKCAAEIRQEGDCGAQEGQFVSPGGGHVIFDRAKLSTRGSDRPIQLVLRYSTVHPNRTSGRRRPRPLQPRARDLLFLPTQAPSSSLTLAPSPSRSCSCSCSLGSVTCLSASLTPSLACSSSCFGSNSLRRME